MLKTYPNTFYLGLKINVFDILKESLAIGIDGCTKPLKSVEINSVQDFIRCRGFMQGNGIRDTA